MDKINTKITQKEVKAVVERAMELVKTEKGVLMIYYSVRCDMLVAKPKRKLSDNTRYRLNMAPELVAGEWRMKGLRQLVRRERLLMLATQALLLRVKSMPCIKPTKTHASGRCSAENFPLTVKLGGAHVA